MANEGLVWNPLLKMEGFWWSLLLGGGPHTPKKNYIYIYINICIYIHTILTQPMDPEKKV